MNYIFLEIIANSGFQKVLCNILILQKSKIEQAGSNIGLSSIISNIKQFDSYFIKELL